MHLPSETGHPAARRNRNSPHIFEEMVLQPGSLPFQPRWPGAGYVPPPIPAGKSRICGLCGKGPHDKNHIDGTAEADAESPNWG